jgi:transcription initiation factor TFIIE subunit alpha
MKAVNREYFYIDYRRAIDATKYKLHILDERIKKDAAPTQEKKELRCPQCKAQWTFVEVLDSIDLLGRESGFICKNCGDPLKEIEHEGDSLDADDTPAKFNKFFAPLLKLMAQIDEVTIPAIEGQDALAGAIELPRDKDINPAAKHEAVDLTVSKPTAVKGMAMAPEKIEVSIATDSEQSIAARAAEQERQAKIALQNQLPDWHTKSTITNRDSNGGSSAVKVEANGVDTPVIKTELVEETKDKGADLDDVFARIEAERQAQAANEEEESSEEEEEDDEFEDVVASTPSGLPDAKRVKLESSAAPSPANGATPAVSTGDGGDESDEDEFVDV